MNLVFVKTEKLPDMAKIGNSQMWPLLAEFRSEILCRSSRGKSSPPLCPHRRIRSFIHLGLEAYICVYVCIYNICVYMCIYISYAQLLDFHCLDASHRRPLCSAKSAVRSSGQDKVPQS